MTAEDFLTALQAGMARVREGDRAGGRAQFQALWSRLEADPDPVLECVFAHHFADAQGAAVDELAWDLRALEAAQRCTDEDARRHGATMVSIAAFRPSLHASLAQDYVRLGDLAGCRAHLAAARDAVGVLADDAYGRMVRAGIDSIARQLAAAGG